MSSKSYTYSETTEQRDRPQDEPTIVTTTVTMEQRNSGGVDITHYIVEKKCPDGYGYKLDCACPGLHMCIQTPECAFWDKDGDIKVKEDKFYPVGLCHPYWRISVSFLRRAAQNFRDNAYKQEEVPPSDELILPSEYELERIMNPRRGRPRIYTDDEKKSKHREQALKSYYRRKALKQHLREPINGDEVSFPVSANSKVLGDFYEEVTFKRTNGTYRKKQE